MLSAFLEATTIHGLRYIKGSEHPLSRLAWALCVASSFTAAAIITYFNVVNWGSQPSVVTKVQVTHLKSLQVAMPTVTVCPHTPNFARLLVGYYNEHYKYGDNADLERGAKIAIVKQQLKHSASVYNALDGLEEFRPCHPTNATSEACELLRLLNAIREVNRLICDYQIDPAEFVTGYAASAIVDRIETSLVHLEEAYRDECVYDGPKEDKKKIPNSLSGSLELTRMYLRFHKLEEGAPVKSLDEFNLIKDKLVPDLHDFGSMGHLLGKLMSLEMLQDSHTSFSSRAGEAEEFRKAVLEHFFNEVMSGLEGVALQAPDDFFELMSYYAYEPETLSLAMRDHDKKSTSPVQSGNVTIGELLDSCDTYPEECQKYHNKISLTSSKKNQELIAKLFKLSMGNFGKLEPGNISRSLLPGCTWDKADGICWDEIISDGGICFTNYYKDDTIIFNGTKNHGYLLDVGSEDQGVSVNDIFNDWSPSEDAYEVLITQRGHFSVSRLTTSEDVAVGIKARTASATFLDTQLSYASVVRTTPGFRGMAPDRRECLFPDEKELRFFPEYSEPSCMLECAWDRARESCSCIPWFLKDYYPGSPMCEVAGNGCFKKIVDDRYENPPDGCDEVTCPADCETAEFTFEMGERENVKYSSFCTKYMEASQEEKDIVCGHYNEKFSFLGHGTDVWGGERKLVYHNLNVQKKTALGILLTATVSAIDMISNIGGTLGLFTGFSILSGVEVLYWVVKWGAGNKNKKKNSEERST